MRILSESGDVLSCPFVASKTHVAPIKQKLTIPKLELQGAVMSVRLIQSVLTELRSLSFSRVVYWTDSVTVRRYVNNESTRFKTFVAVRVSEIRESSNPSDWHYLKSAENPADDCTRGLSASQLCADHRWLLGPEFLRSMEDSWPQYPIDTVSVSSDDVNLRKKAPHPSKCANNTCSSVVNTRSLNLNRMTLTGLIDTNTLSSYYVLRRKAALILRAIKNFAAGCSSFQIAPITDLCLRLEELNEAESVLLIDAQRDVYSDEIRSLDARKKVSKRSSIRNLCPFYDGDFIRVGGRLCNAPIGAEAKHQILLPHSHHVSYLVVKYMHQKVHHAGTEHVVASTRLRFWPVRARCIAKKVIRDCRVCHGRCGEIHASMRSPTPHKRDREKHSTAWNTDTI
ncbi:uncharacterized protein LOC141910289 [Tubulanus polymorphus]|uniref:uncharacterized protein LOC141910289 n=1 Tax=Tubulanus polymorphus TaxID=672921 RepID=UPI003DA434A9